jgi:aminomethyltransferase
MGELKRTPLYEWHKARGARLIDFAGWEMPVYYEGIVAEHQATREKAGMFDLSHMGEIEVKGPDALEYLQSVMTNDVSAITDGQAQYSVMCYENGTIVDDLLITKLPDRYMLVVNASNIDKDFNWLKSHIKGRVEVVDRSDEFSIIAVQGPKSEDIIAEVYGESLRNLLYYHAVELDYQGKKNVVLLSRTGYTGEDGFEILLPNEFALETWNKLFDAGEKYGLTPVGLGARDTLRMEMKFALYGHDISDQTNPLEAGLGWVVKLDKEFVGAPVLRSIKEKGLERKLVAFEMVDRGIPRQHCPVVIDGKPVGEVTSGNVSPSTGKSVGLAYVPTAYSKIGTEIAIDIRGKILKAIIVKAPFVPSHVKK